MNAPVHFKPRVINRKHIGFFICKMLKCMILEIFYCFLADPLTFLLLPSKVKQLIKNTEQFLVFLINNIYPNIIPFVPC